MEILIDHSLVENAPVNEYPVLDDSFKSGFFVGHIIKNKYDEERFSIDKKILSKRALFNSNNGPYKLYGHFQNKGTDNQLINKLVNTPPQNIGEYSSILTSCGLSCLTCFLHFTPGLYPIDNSYIETFFSPMQLENFCCNKSVPSFQRLGYIYFFAIVNHNFL
jgi:hypothetical protein